MSDALRISASSPVIDGTPGGTVQAGFDVTNDGDDVRRFAIELVESGPPSGASFRVPDEPFSLDPQQTVAILVRIAIPPTVIVDRFEIRLDATDLDDPEAPMTRGQIVTVIVSRTVSMPGAVPGERPTVVCPNCGHENDADEQFCGNCGFFLEWAGSAGSSPPAAPVRSRRRRTSPQPTHRCRCRSRSTGTTPGGGSVMCPTCGTANPGERRFCTTCGVELQLVWVARSASAGIHRVSTDGDGCGAALSIAWWPPPRPRRPPWWPARRQRGPRRCRRPTTTHPTDAGRRHGLKRHDPDRAPCERHVPCRGRGRGTGSAGILDRRGAPGRRPGAGVGCRARRRHIGRARRHRLRARVRYRRACPDRWWGLADHLAAARRGRSELVRARRIRPSCSAGRDRRRHHDPPRFLASRSPGRPDPGRDPDRGPGGRHRAARRAVDERRVPGVGVRSATRRRHAIGDRRGRRPVRHPRDDGQRVHARARRVPGRPECLELLEGDAGAVPRRVGPA